MVKRKFFSLMGSKSLGGPEWAQAGLVPREETAVDQALSTNARV